MFKNLWLIVATLMRINPMTKQVVEGCEIESNVNVVKTDTVEQLNHEDLFSTQELKIKQEIEEQLRKQAEEEARQQAGMPAFGEDGLLIMYGSDRAQEVVNLLLSIPGHRNGTSYHSTWGIDDKISQLTVEEAVWVLHRIEGAGFGQTGDGYAGYDTPAAHQKLISSQLNGRFDGSIYNLLYMWGCYPYGGY